MCDATKNAIFCISWKEKNPWWTFKKNQQNIGHNKIDL
jgi:hypothetical protein